jgi:hypothetical protein
MRVSDVGIGLAAAVLVFVLSTLTPGSFNSFAPWLFWAVVVLFIAGMTRRLQANESIWLKAVAVNLSWFLLIPLLLSAEYWRVACVTAGTVLPTIAGIFSRRLVATRK